MQGKTIKTAQAGTRSTCSERATLTCSKPVFLNDDDSCTGGGTLAVCEKPENLSIKSASRKTVACCGEGQLVAASLTQCGEGDSLCNESGSTLKI